VFWGSGKKRPPASPSHAYVQSFGPENWLDERQAFLCWWRGWLLEGGEKKREALWAETKAFPRTPPDEELFGRRWKCGSLVKLKVRHSLAVAWWFHFVCCSLHGWAWIWRKNLIKSKRRWSESQTLSDSPSLPRRLNIYKCKEKLLARVVAVFLRRSRRRRRGRRIWPRQLKFNRFGAWEKAPTVVSDKSEG
jgi:hypothetical protein